MAIKNIQIKNFTVFSNLDIDFCKGINLLIGKNGVGKTHLLKSLYYTPSMRLADSDGKILLTSDNLVLITKSNASSVFGVDDEYYERNFKEAEQSVNFDVSKRPPIIFIPAKEMLTHAKGLLAMKNKYGENMPFDSTLLDIIEKAQAWKVKETPEIAKKIAPVLEKIMDGVVEARDDSSFWMVKTSGEKIPFSMEAEGLKYLGLIWQLIMNESITKGSIILWDEPEGSLNPEDVDVLAEVILELQRHGVQIIAATHSYLLIKYLSIKRQETDEIAFFNMYKTENGTKCEREEDYDLLENNSIVNGNIKLLEAESLGGAF